MPESLLEKYPHLKSLLSEGSKIGSGVPASPVKEVSPNALVPLSDRSSNVPSSATEEITLRKPDEGVRKSILGPGVGSRKLPQKPLGQTPRTGDANR